MILDDDIIANCSIQSFRTADPRAGSLDADFHAFENSLPNQFQLQQPHDFANAFPMYRPSSQPTMNGWASDFQKLSINEQPVPAQQFRQEAPLVRSTVGGWHTEFMRQRSGASTPISQGKQAVREPQMNNMPPSMMMSNYSQPMYGQYNGMYQDGGFQQQQQHGPTVTEQQAPQMSDADFEAAFADAFAHAQEMDQAKLQATTQETPLQREQAPVEPMENIKIGSDAIQYREWKDRTADQDTRDADELARTAGQLLTSVQHDTSTKFQNSSFLDLMRRIRDREVEVQNNDLTNVATGEAATTVSSDNLREPNGLFEPISDPNTTNAASSHFDFPDMDGVYAPSAADLDESTEQQQQQPALWATGAQHTHPPYTTYGFDDDQYPAAQQPQSALHPGGKYYPDQSPRLRRADPEMSGAVPVTTGGGPSAISASDFDYVDESGNLARRFT